MEEELRIFKMKISYRFENAEIPKNYTFPRIHSPEEGYEKLNKKVEYFVNDQMGMN